MPDQLYDQATAHRPIWEIAREIRTDWGTRLSVYARPYVDAMAALDKITDSYYMDDAKSIVLYFLTNAGQWRGETARRVKAELKAMCK